MSEMSRKLKSLQEAVNRAQGCEEGAHSSPVCCLSEMQCIFCAPVKWLVDGYRESRPPIRSQRGNDE